MKVEMARGEIFDSERAMVKFSTREVSYELAEVIAKNKRLISQQARDVREALKPKFTDEEQERQDEYDKQCFMNKRKYGSDPKTYQLEQAKLELEYAEELFRRDENREAETKFLNASTEVEVYAIKKSLLPETLTADELGPMVAAIVDDIQEAKEQPE
jgi:hypothetical protein